MSPNGPALGQRLIVWQGAGQAVRVPVSNPDGTRPDLSGARAQWFMGDLPAQGRAPSAMPASGVRVRKTDLPVLADAAGGFEVVLRISADDLRAVPPGSVYQHEVWITEASGRTYPVLLGPFVFHATVHGPAT